MNKVQVRGLLESEVCLQLLLLFTTIVVLLFCDIDSYLYAQIGQYDSAVFFMSGKALMNGMTPYVEFTDSKGLLLWLIYGIGYLFDHYSYVGIYWIMCFVVWITLAISYKTANLILGKKFSFFAALLALVPLVHWNFYSETKAEQFCWPAVAWGVYLLLRVSKDLSVTRRQIFILGISLVYCVMIKWSIAVMLFSVAFSVGIYCFQKSKFKPYLFTVLGSLAVAFLPFAIYFTFTESWSSMWQEYFVNTLTSVSVPADNLIMDYGNEWLNLITTKRVLYLFYVFAALVLFEKKHWMISSLPFLCGLFFTALSIRHDEGGHYLTIVGPFSVLFIIFVLRKIQTLPAASVIICFFCVILNVFNVWGSTHYLNNFFTKSNPAFEEYMAVSSVMSSAANNPRIIVIGMDPGLCMGSSLPGTKYWTLQKGRTETMWNEEWDAISRGDADFIVLWGTEKSQYEKSLNSFGYHYLSDYYAGCVFSRHLDKMPESIKEVSPTDIITKKNYCQLYQ